MPRIKVGILGAGRIGKIHAQNLLYRLRDRAEVAVVADINADAPDIQAWGEANQVKLVTDPEVVFQDPSIEAILICSSTNTHAEYIVRAAQAGKHIFCEKPVDLDVQRIVEALAAADKAGVKLQIGFNRRFDHNFRKLREVIQAGQIGDLHILRITSRDPAPPPAEYVAVSGGMFMDMTIHDFDMARYLSGSEVEEVYAAGAVLVDPAIGAAGDIDTATITLRFASGALGVIDNSRKAAYGYDQRAEAFGSKGAVQSANDMASTAMLSTADGVKTEKPLYFFLERYMDSFANELGDFLDAIINDTPTPVTGRDGLMPVLIALAAKESLKTGAAVKVQKL